MALTPRKQLSLDANLLFDLAEGKDFAHDFREEFQSRGYRLLLPPTVRHELHTIYTDGASPTDRELARSALVILRSWGFSPLIWIPQQKPSPGDSRGICWTAVSYLKRSSMMA